MLLVVARTLVNSANVTDELARGKSGLRSALQNGFVKAPFSFGFNPTEGNGKIDSQWLDGR